MDWKKLLETASNAVVTITGHVSFRNSIVADRQTAIAQILGRVQHSTPEQLDAYEVEFLKHAASLANPQERIRAMELYAAFKVAETQHYGQFRGFSFGGGPLA